jgi:hypothetical protein
MHPRATPTHRPAVQRTLSVETRDGVC